LFGFVHEAGEVGIRPETLLQELSRKARLGEANVHQEAPIGVVFAYKTI
jgi:hypothetical protein